jgi:ubiquinone/menaquinone biosynthesis C-methylase UbiE
MLRIANVEEEAVLETARDVLDELGVAYGHAMSEPEDEYPRTAYFSVSERSSQVVDHAVSRPSEEYGYEAEIL